LPAFADYAWSAGPMIVHEPLDTSVLSNFKVGDSIRIDARVFADVYDSADSIRSVTAIVTPQSSAPQTVTLLASGASTYTGYIHLPKTEFFTYHITALNAQGLSRNTPEYEVTDSVTSSVRMAATPTELAVFPNPSHTLATIHF